MNHRKSFERRLLSIWTAVVVSATVSWLPARGATRPTGPEVVPHGARIRVHALAAEGACTGSLVSLERDTLVMAAEQDARTVTVPLASVRVLELSRGHHTHALAAGGIGLLVGMAAGAVIGAATYEPGGFIDLGQGVSMAGGAIAVGVPCGLVGVIVGLVGWEQWSRVDPADVRIEPFAVGPRGATVAASVHF